nr:MAG TPA: hypothetical protein [Caudoviricetes sp.]
MPNVGSIADDVCEPLRFGNQLHVNRMLCAGDVFAPVVTAGELDVNDIPGFQAVQAAIEQQRDTLHLDRLLGPILQQSAAHICRNDISRIVPLIRAIPATDNNVGHKVLEIYALLHSLCGRSRVTAERCHKLGHGVTLRSGVLIWVTLERIKPRREQRVGQQDAIHLFRPLRLLRCRGVLAQHFVIEQAQLLDLFVPCNGQLFFGRQRMRDFLEVRHCFIRGIGVRDSCNDRPAGFHRRLICRLISSVLGDFGSSLGVVIGKQLGQEIVLAVRAEGRNLPNAVDAARSLRKVALAVGEADGAVIAKDLDEAAQIHGFPDIVLGLPLDLDAEAGIVPVFFLHGMEHHHNIFLKLIETVVHEPDELFADEAVALERQAAVALPVFGILLDCPKRHEGDELAAGIKHQRVKALRVHGCQIVENFLIVLRLDIRDAVARLNTVNAEVDIDVQRIRGGQRQRGLADAGITSNQHTDLLFAFLNFLGVTNHSKYSFRAAVQPQMVCVMRSWQNWSKFPVSPILVALNCSWL